MKLLISINCMFNAYFFGYVAIDTEEYWVFGLSIFFFVTSWYFAFLFDKQINDKRIQRIFNKIK
jgi:hypothetical protein